MCTIDNEDYEKMRKLVEIKDVCKIYNPGENEVRALNHVTLTIGEGEFVAIIGQSGSGKSTLMNMLGCLDTPTSGKYLLHGLDVSHMTDDEQSDVRNREIGFIFQGFNLIPSLTALENVELGLIKGHKVEKQKAHQLAKEALDKVGLLDEDFSPDMYEDKDFCTRVNLAGLAVVLCFNSYIFKSMDRHSLYGDIDMMLEQGKQIFKEKWGCHIDYFNNARTELINMIKADRRENIEVLELGCAMGGTLNMIKRLWPLANVHGVEYDANVVRIGSSVTDIIQGDVENMQIPYSHNQFDYIICADVLEHLRKPETAIMRFLPYLKDNGYFIISLPNVRHYAVVMMLALLGRFDYADAGILDSTHLKFFTKDTALEMMDRAGLKVIMMNRNYNGHPEDNEFISRLTQAFEVVDAEELKVFQYYFLAVKK